MADSVLSKLVQTDKDTKKSLESIDSTLQKIYKLESKTTKVEETQRKRAVSDSKKRTAEDVGVLDKVMKKEGKKKKGILASLFDSGDFGGIPKL